MPFIQFQIRRGLANEWSTVNPILASGEMGLETDTFRIKIGNGILNWNSLPYALRQDLQDVTALGSSTNVAVQISNSTVSSNSVTGALTVTGGVGISGNLNVGGNISIQNSNVGIMTSSVNVVNVGTSPVILDSFPISAYSTVKYIIQSSRGTDYHSMEAFLVNDSVNAYLTVYASLKNNVKLISLSADIQLGQVQLKAVGNNTGNTVKILATKI